MRPTSLFAVFCFLIRTQAFVLENGWIGSSSRFGKISKPLALQPTNVCPSTSQDEVLYRCNKLGQSSIEEIEQILDESSDGAGSLRSSIIDQVFPMMLSLCRSESTDAAVRVDKLLNRLEMEMNAGNENVALTNKHYTIAIVAWGKAGNADAPERAEMIMERLKRQGESSPGLKPTRVTYNALMNANAKLDNHERITALLDEMENKDIYPATIDFNVLLSVYGRLGRPRDAEQIVQGMIDRSQQLSLGQQCYPDLYSYNMLLNAWSRSSESNRGKRAEDIINYLCDHSECSFSPDKNTYLAAVSALVHSGEKNVIQRVERLVNKAKSTGIDSDVFLESQLLDAYASCSSPGSASKAEAHLNALQAKGIANTVSFNTVLKAWKASNDPNSQKRAEILLGRMKELGFVNTISYSTLISTYAKKGNVDSAERADAMLSEMSAMGLAPNVWTLNSVMSAWVRCRQIRRAENILDRMEQGVYAGRGEDSRTGTVAPNVVSYTTLMNGWAKSKDPKSFEKTGDVFRRMVQAYNDGNTLAQPNLFSFVTLIDSLVRSKTKRAAEKAESVLFEMYEDYKDGNLDAKPNAKLVSIVIECWQKSRENDSGERAEALLNWLIDINEVENDEELMPNEFTFTSTISAWGKTRKFGKAARARSILSKMIKMHQNGVIKAKPNVHAYTAVINSCAYCENDLLEKRDALQIAVKTYKELVASEHAKPNQVTFATLLTALRNLMPAGEKRAAAAKTVFQHCADAGLVTELVLKRLQSTLSADQLVDIVGGNAISSHGTVNTANLPESWTKNTVYERR
ncbi:unnamed protein product [Cylindrotheca closterium]|uniref:Pentacotripeptide-repeat region of PRORP domain-containing protein n=1 Tax=Cylindrotheca closterium TaxID=2856 RepID=A0AAD2CP41_9STRA|nr:unnamed protein product [Cylindrotheca closterium]